MSLPLSAPLPPPATNCRIKVSNARLKLGRHPTLKVTVRCAHGCVGPLFICPGDSDCAPGGHTVRPFGISSYFTLGSGTSKQVTIRLRPRTPLLGQAAHRTRVSVTVYDALLAADPSRPVLGDDPYEPSPVTFVHTVARVSGAGSRH